MKQLKKMIKKGVLYLLCITFLQIISHFYGFEYAVLFGIGMIMGEVGYKIINEGK